MKLSFNQIPRIDENSRRAGVLFKILHRIRYEFRNRWFIKQGKRFWTDALLLEYHDLHRKIGSAILAQQPLSVGRLGGVEASLVMWARGIPKIFLRPDLKPIFLDTSQGATNAGIRPRNQESYCAFAKLAWDALECMDFQGVWKSGQEATVLQYLKPRALFDVEIAGPDGNYQDHWTSALKGKRTLVVSPFLETINRQIPIMKFIWPKLDWFEGTQFNVVRFPYLIDEGCEETWWEVYQRIGSVVFAGDYDVALFGCGGLGLPFAHLAKEAGRVGIHLGGHLQLLFGIYGQRHLDHEWHRQHINDTWVRPEAVEVPKTASRVEGGCYW